MAKLSREDRRAQIAEREENARIRRRYDDALRMGYSVEEAAGLAHGHGAIALKPGAQRVHVKGRDATMSSSGANPLPDAQKVSVHGGGQAPAGATADTDNIPPNWEELPWPQMKSLAESLNGGRDVKSRKQAHEIIGGALATHSA